MSSLRQRYHQERRISWTTLFWLFIAGSLMGFVIEGVWHFLRKGTWGFRVATLWGPFCVIYGVGAVVMHLVAIAVERRHPLVQFSVFALVGSVLEYLASLFQEAVFGTVSWNYSHHAINLGGRISLQMTLIWGAIGMALMYAVLPLLLSAFNRLRLNRRTILCRLSAAFMAFNLLATSIALLRWQERVHSAEPASNIIETYMDENWPDERMRERFPNMKFVHGT